MVRLTLYRALTCIVLIFGIFSIANSQAPVPIKPAIIRDLSGYWVHGGGGNSPDRFFDAFGHIDPKNGVTTFPATHRGDTTFALPFRMDGIYYPKGALGRGKMMYNGDRGLRLLFDFTGAADVLDTTRRVKLTDIYAYNKVYENGDTMYVYNFDEVLRKPVSERWKYIARPDSLLQPIAKVSTESNIGYGKWVNKAVNDSVRYLLIRFVEKDRGFYKTTANFAELVFYGNYQYNPAAVVKRDGVYTGPLPKKNTLKQTYGKFVGTNEGTGFDTSTLKYDNLVRLYGATDYWDTTRSATNTATAPYTFDYFLDVNVKYYKHFKSRGAIFWWSIKGPSKYAESTVPGGSGGMMPNMNRWGLEPEDPNSYWRSGDFFYNYAAKYGSVAVPAGNTKWQGDAGFPNGQNALNYVENGNEEQFNGMTMLAYALKSFVDYDGWEGRVGTPGRTGLINADPTFKLIQAGTVFPDSNYIDCLHFFSKVLRTDGKFVWSVINNHHYSRTYNNKVEYSPTYEQQVMETGESAEKDLLLDKMTAYTKAYYNILGGDTSVKVYLTEIGYDNFSTPAATQEQLYIPWTTSGTPLIPGLDSLRSKAIIMSRMEMILNFTPLSGYNEFFFHNVADNSPMLFATCGRVTGGQMAPIRFPWFWYRAGMYNHLKDYYPDKIISKDGDDLWVTKWTHINYPDSVCFAVWKGSYNNSTLPNQSISVGSVVANNVKKVELSFTQPDGTSSAISAGGGYINVNAEERPIFYFFKQDTVMIANQPPTANAGIDMVITLPTDSIQLTGYGSDP
ncbi:MAG: hypothetical protein H7Y27_14260, partial [Gemmatimonadaceae bacterium]|nr:hypothetical protein [Chitinophagaceae bacterium]